MKYALFIYWNESEGLAAPAGADAVTIAKHRRFGAELAESGRMLGGERLRPESDARRIRVRGGRRSVIDGPFAETKEVLGGFYLVEAATLEEAVEIAARCPSAEYGTVEVRPVWTT